MATKTTPAAKKTTAAKTAAKPAAKTTKPAAKTASKPAAKTTEGVKHSRMDDAAIRDAILVAVKNDPTLANSWSRTLRTLRAEGKASGGHVRFRELFVAVAAESGTKKTNGKPASKPAAKTRKSAAK